MLLSPGGNYGQGQSFDTVIVFSSTLCFAWGPLPYPEDRVRPRVCLGGMNWFEAGAGFEFGLDLEARTDMVIQIWVSNESQGWDSDGGFWLMFSGAWCGYEPCGASPWRR